MALPPILVTLVLVAWIARDDRAAKRNMLVMDVHSLADAVTSQIDASFVLARALSRSNLLLTGNLDGFVEQAADALKDTPGVSVTVYSPDARPLVGTPALVGSRPVSAERIEAVRRALAARGEQLSDVLRAAEGGEDRIALEFPVVRGGEPIYDLEFLVDPAVFTAVLQRQRYPSGWLSGLIDRKGAFIARLPMNSASIGSLASADFRDAAKEGASSVSTHNSVDGRKIVSAYEVLSQGWTVGVAADAREFDAGPSAALLTAVLAAVALAASFVISLSNGRRLTRQIRAIQARAQQLATGSEFESEESGIDELDALGDALVQASDILRRRAERQKTAEERLRRSEEHFRLLADSVPQLVWTARADGRIDYANARRENYGKEGVRRTDWEGIIHPDDRRATAEAWLKASEAGDAYEKEHRLLVAGNEYRWHLSRAAPLKDETGAVVRWYGTTTDINEHKLREERIRSLIAEVNHRSRNLLSVALSISRQSVKFGDSAADFEQKYSRRLLALTASQDLLTEGQWAGVALEALIRAQTRPENPSLTNSITSSGPALVLRPSAAQTLGMAIHELFVNATSYGALSTPEGRVSVIWRIVGRDCDAVFEMEWRESGGPTVNQAPKRGFGGILISSVTAKGLNAKSQLLFEAEGVVWTLRAPLEGIANPQ